MPPLMIFAPKTWGRKWFGTRPLGVISARRCLANRRTEKNAPFSTHLRTKEPLDIPVDQFLASSASKTKGNWMIWGLNLIQTHIKLGVEIGSFD